MAKDNNLYDLDGVAYSDREFKARKEYELEFHEKESLKELKKCIDNRKYKTARQISEHLEYLEDLMEKLKRIISLEERGGLVNLSLKREYGQIRELYNKLSLLYNKF